MESDERSWTVEITQLCNEPRKAFVVSSLAMMQVVRASHSSLLVLSFSVYLFLVFAEKNDDVGYVTVDTCVLSTIAFCFDRQHHQRWVEGVRACVFFSSWATH